MLFRDADDSPGFVVYSSEYNRGGFSSFIFILRADPNRPSPDAFT